MKLHLVMDEIGDVAAQIPGLRVYRWPDENPTPPAALVMYPEEILFDEAFQRGLDRMPNGGLRIVAGNVYARAARDLLSGYCDGDGAQSIKRVFYLHDWQSCSFVRPTSVQFEPWMSAGVPLISALFTLDIAGPGTEA